MKSCEHEFENGNCTNCANGLPTSDFECARTKGRLKEYCHERAEEICKVEYKKGYAKGRADAIEEIHTDLSTEIALLNETDMTDVNLYTFAVRIKEITDKLFMK